MKRTEEIAHDLINMRVATAGGEQVMPALKLVGVPFWLAGINTNMIAKELRPQIRAFRREVVDVLYRHFAQPQQEPPKPDTLSFC